MSCPIPVEHLAEKVPEIENAHEYDRFQEEYGISLSHWLEENEEKAQKLLDEWWVEQSFDRQQKELVVYFEHIKQLIASLEFKAHAISDLIVPK